MVLIFGIAPELHDAEVYCSETKKHVEVSCKDEIESMYDHLKSNATKSFSNDSNLGTICICIGDLKYVSYDYNNNIRKKLIENGLEAGFKGVEIIDTCTAMFFDAIRQSNFYPEKDSVIWIHNYGTWYIWKLINDSVQLIFCEKPNDNTWITESLINKYLEISQKNPDAIIYGHQVRDFLFDYFRSRYNNLHIFESFNFVSGALIKAKIMAGKTKQINALNLLGRDLKLFVGKNEISHFEQYQTVPVGKALRVKKNANDLVLKIVDGLCKEKIPLPPTTACVIVIEIDGNGIYKISVIDESVAKLIQQNDFEEIKCSD